MSMFAYYSGLKSEKNSNFRSSTAVYLKPKINVLLTNLCTKQPQRDLRSEKKIEETLILAFEVIK